MTTLSEARQDLYNKIFEWEHRKDADMSRFLKPKLGYHAGETETIEPVSWQVVEGEAEAGYVKKISVTYRTGKNELVTFSESGDFDAEKKLSEMLSHRSITYPE